LGYLARRNSGWPAELRGLDSQQVFLLAEGEAKSTAVFSRHKDSQALVIHLFGTAGPCQRQGYGTALLRMLQKFAGGVEIFVEVATEKIPAWWLSKSFLGTATKFSKPRLWETTALLRWRADTEALCSIRRQGQTVRLCPFQGCSFESSRSSDVQGHIQSMHPAKATAETSQETPKNPICCWQEPTFFRGEQGTLERRINHASKTTLANSGSEEEETVADLQRTLQEGKKKKKNKGDEQEQKWVRKIVALAKQTNKSGLSAKAKTLFRMMKADLRNSASSSEEEEDSDDDSSESGDSYTCVDCGRDFSSKLGLGQHRRHW